MALTTKQNSDISYLLHESLPCAIWKMLAGAFKLRPAYSLFNTLIQSFPTHVVQFSSLPKRLPFEKCLFIDQHGKNQGEIKVENIAKQFPFNESEHKLRIVNMNPPTCRLVSIEELQMKEAGSNSPDAPNAKIKNKDIYFGTATTDHDLLIKCRKLSEWLDKRYNVRIIVEKKGSINEQRSKETIISTVLRQIENQYQQIGKEIVDENRIIMSIKGVGNSVSK